jgi:hypothetical protein
MMNIGRPETWERLATHGVSHRGMAMGKCWLLLTLLSRIGLKSIQGIEYKSGSSLSMWAERVLAAVGTDKEEKR